MRIDLIATEHELGALQKEWNSLLQRSAAETVFLTWEWLGSWWSAYGGGKQLFVLVARDEAGECQGIAPLYIQRSGRRRVLRFLGDGTYDSDYLDFIILRGQEAPLLAAFFDRLQELHREWDAMQLNEIPAASSSLSFLQGLKTRAGWLFRREDVPCGIGKLPGSWEEFLQALKPRFRTSVRASLRNIEQHNWTFEVLADERKMSSWLRDLYDLHSGRWALRQQSGVFANENKRTFYEYMARSFLERGWLHLTRLRVGDAVIACQFGFVYGQTYHLLQEGFDTRCTHVGPGISLRAATIRDLISRGVHTYDFLGGIGRHKTDWGATEKTSCRLAIAPPTLAGHAFVELPRVLQDFKDSIKKLVPRRLQQSLRGIRSAFAPSPNDAAIAEPVADLMETRTWKETAAVGLYETGVIRAVQLISRRFEIRPAGSGSFIPWERTSNPKVIILCYHRVGSGGVPLYSALDPEVFAAQMRFLRERYRLVSLDALAQELSRPGSPQSVAITFDDGYRDVYTHAFPILQRYQVPATIYLTADAVEKNEVAWYDRVFLALSIAPGEKLDLLLDRPRRFLLPSPAARLRGAEELIAYLRTLPDERRKEFCVKLESHVPLPADQITNRMLRWEQIQVMQRAGVTFGSHTLSHPAISRLEPAALERELRESKALLEGRLDVAVQHFAYPFGKPADYGETPDQVARCGYKTAATTNWGINTPNVNRYELSRVSIGEERRLAVFATKLAQLFLTAEDDACSSKAASAVKQKSACSSS